MCDRKASIENGAGMRFLASVTSVEVIACDTAPPLGIPAVESSKACRGPVTVARLNPRKVIAA
eukprot:6213453-Pleurochrysis_carterae.AAC.10